MFNLQKRINRKTYWLGYVSYLLGFGLFGLIIAVLPLSGTTEFEPLFDIPLFVILLILLIINICITRQRANDISGKHPLAWLFFSIFLIGPIIGLIPGEKLENKFGKAPPDYNLFD